MTAAVLPGTTSATTSLRRVHELMDARVMGPRVARALGAPGAVCHVLDAKFEPGLRCTVLYRVGDLLVRGDLVDGAAEDLAGSRPVVTPGVRLSCFPDDPDLPLLAQVVAPESSAGALREALSQEDPVLRCRTRLLRYRPGKRATLAVEARGPARSAAAGNRRLVVKAYHDDRKAAAVAAEAVLLHATCDPAAPLRFAPVLAHLPRLSLVVQEHVAGVPLDDVLGGGAEPAVALSRAAVALAALHRQPAVSRRVRAIDAELTRFGTRARRIATVDPLAGAALTNLADRLAATVTDARAADAPAGAVALVHGDCKPSQFLLRGERDVVLLDLDSCGLGDPAGDVGTFLATLRQRAVRDALARRTAPAGAAARRDLAEVFLRAYTEAAGAPPEDLRRRITWYEAVALERKALRCFARAPRSPLTRALVDAGHACLDRMGGIR